MYLLTDINKINSHKGIKEKTLLAIFELDWSNPIMHTTSLTYTEQDIHKILLVWKPSHSGNLLSRHHVREWSLQLRRPCCQLQQLSVPD